MKQKGDRNERRKMELYIHVPFCVRKCAYCDFFSGAFGREAEARYFEELLREISEEEDTAGSLVTSVFFGGGTPSSVDPRNLRKVMELLRQKYRLEPGAEISLEANPGTLSREKLRIYREMGVNRLSIGLQSTENELLKQLGRIHTYEEFLESFRLAREEGFGNINIDLMSGLPGETGELHRTSLLKVLSLRPEHLSCYSLIIEEGTPFHRLYGEKGTFREEKLPPLPTEEEDRIMYHETGELLRRSGYERYEVSNYALPGFTCRHNTGYWTGVPYRGFGAAAASFIEKEDGTFHRFKSAGSLSYRQLPREEEEVLELQDRMSEFMILGLRLTAGVSKREFLRRFGRTLSETYGSIVEKYVRQGALREEGDRVYFTDLGMDVSNVILREFL